MSMCLPFGLKILKMERNMNDNVQKNENDELENEVSENFGIEDYKLSQVEYLSDMYQSWFLDYASYVILERAVPYLNDGLKPVQRRILHAMKRLDDGRFNKVANIIGFTMQYHPHGDASIGDALVTLGQKDLLVETQGNWGNILTGDNAAAPRYIEARLSKLGLEILFNAKTTKWKMSYDGRNKEPVHLPVKFPLMLALGVEGIAVGLASKILPHNFIELIEASIAYLKNEEFEIFPDFLTGGMADFSRYNKGLQGGKVRVRAKISKLDKKTLIITEIPFGKTTGSLIDSILNANDKGKIKIKKIDDNTAANVEIQIHLHANISPDQTIDALYAFTDCEISISPNACIIYENKPEFIGVDEILKRSADKTVALLKLELEIRLSELNDQWHLSSLEKIFIENRIYNLIEDCETWESIIETIDRGLDPFKKLLQREVTREDIIRLTEIKIKRISKYNAFKAEEFIKSLEEEMKLVTYDLKHIIDYSIHYFKQLIEKYGKGRERKTEIKSFDTIVATKVVAANQKLFVNRKEGFFGTSLKKEEFVADCSDIDDIIVFLKTGKYYIAKVNSKSFVGKDIIHIAVFKKNDKRTVYNVIYKDGKDGNIMIKRFNVTGITRDKEYDLTKGSPNSKVLYFTNNPNGEAEVIKVNLKQKARIRNLQFEFDFSSIAIKGRSSIGNILSRHDIDKIRLMEKGVSTLGGRKIWFDNSVNRLNSENRGTYLGSFSGNDMIIAFSQSGKMELCTYDLSHHFEDNIILIEKYDKEKIYMVVFFDAEQKYHYLKRFQVEETEKSLSIIGDNSKSRLVLLTNTIGSEVELFFGGKHRKRENEIISADDFIAIKGIKARGKRVTIYEIEKLELIINESNNEKLIDDENNGIDIETEATENNEQEKVPVQKRLPFK